MTYAIISIGGKQHRVREGEWLLVDRLPYDEGATFEPRVLLIGGDGEALLGEDELGGRTVRVKVTGHELGQKLIVGKHRQRTGYRRRNGFRARLSRIEIESIGAKPARASRAKAAKAEPKEPAADTVESAEEKPKPKPKPRARKPAAKEGEA